MTTTPELIAIALFPVAFRRTAIRGLSRGGQFHPRGGDELLTVPFSFLQVKLPESRNVLGATAESVAAERDPLRARFPLWIFDPERFEQPGLQVIEHGLAGDFLHHGGKHVASP